MLSVRFLKVPEGPFDAHEALWGSFGSHFGDFLEVSGISKNVCFTFVKLYFLRFGRVLVRDFFVLCFCIDTFRIFLKEFYRFVGPQGVHGVPNGSLLGTLRDQISAELALWWHHGFKVVPRPQKGAIWDHFGVTLGCLLDLF